MLDFQKVTLSDAPLLQKVFAAGRSRLCDESAGTALMWRSFLSIRRAVQGDCFFLQYGALEKPSFLVPLGDIKKGLALLAAHCRETEQPLRFICVPESLVAEVAACFCDPAVSFDRDFCDYLYETEKLITFSGHHLAGQRNHKNYFLANNPDWRFEQINEQNLDAVRAFYEEYNREHDGNSSPYYVAEQRAVREVLENPAPFDLAGGALFAGERVVAFSFGEIVGDTMLVHVEKAHRTVRGAYPMIVSEFLRRFALGKAMFVNREEDMGEPGLRASKLSYHPVQLLKKYIVEEKEK